MNKRTLFLVAVLCFFGLSTKAQDVFHKGDIVGNVQIGVGNYHSYGIGFHPTSISLDFGAFDNIIKGENGSIGIGGYFGIANYRDKWVVNDVKYKETNLRMCFGVRGSFHYQFVDNLDTYAGFMMGLYTNNYNYVVKDTHGNNIIVDDKDYHKERVNFAHSMFIGARYYFSDAFGVSAEAGYGFTYLSAGITFKF